MIADQAVASIVHADLIIRLAHDDPVTYRLDKNTIHLEPKHLRQYLGALWVADGQLYWHDRITYPNSRDHVKISAINLSSPDGYQALLDEVHKTVLDYLGR